MPKTHSLSHWARREKLKAAIANKKAKRDKERRLAGSQNSGSRPSEEVSESDRADEETAEGQS